MSSPAERIIAKFGGARRLAEAIDITPAAVYRWTYPRERQGSAGYIPTKWIPQVKAAADLLGIELTADDWNA